MTEHLRASLHEIRDSLATPLDLTREEQRGIGVAFEFVAGHTNRLDPLAPERKDFERLWRQLHPLVTHFNDNAPLAPDELAEICKPIIELIDRILA